MTEKAIHQHRKDEHLSLAIKNWQEKDRTSFSTFTGLTFQDIRLVPQTLPEQSLEEIQLETHFLGAQFEFPFYIEAMTGGAPKGDQVNEQLAEIAKNQHLALAVGSQSIALKYPELAASFKKVREVNPNGFLFANLGAHHDLEAAKRAVEMLDADALELHVNVAQELAMKDSQGDRIFYWLDHINEIAHQLEVPVIVKEVGFGMSQETFAQLAQTEIAAINIGGKGGTDFAWIERQRGGEFLLEDYGLTTVESLLEAQFSNNQKPLVATGGITRPAEIVKAEILGAQLTSTAGYLLKVLVKEGATAVEELLLQWKQDLKKFYALQGVKNQAALRHRSLLYSQAAQSFMQQRKK